MQPSIRAQIDVLEAFLAGRYFVSIGLASLLEMGKALFSRQF